MFRRAFAFMVESSMKRSFITLISFIIMLLQCGGAEQKVMNTLILSGQNNHDWKSTTPKIQKILEATGRFSVTVTEHPEQITPETLANVDVILSNWNTFGKNVVVREWPTVAKEALVQFVKNGKGFVVIHAGGSSFSDWADYQQIVGGIWGKKTRHGPQGEFLVELQSLDHPVTKGLSNFKIFDELWVNMELQPNIQVLASANAILSNKQEPVVFVTHFGKGRCFNLVLGHDAKVMDNPHWQVLCQRGTEWASTGNIP